MSVAESVPNLGQQLIITHWALDAACSVFLALRIYCKLSRGRVLWWDDHFLVASWIALLASTAVTTASAAHGFGMHRSDLDRDSIAATTLLQNISSTFSITASAWSKTSFALTMLRITGYKTRRFIWFAIVTINLTKAASGAVAWISCTPLYKAWTPHAQGTCWDKQSVAYYNLFSGVYSGVMDLVLAFLPWPVVMRMTMRLHERIGVAVAMTMGVFAGITAFVKCSYIPTIFGGDFTYAGVSLVIWGAAESATTIMAASIPMLRVLLQEVTSSPDKRYQAELEYWHELREVTNPGTDAKENIHVSGDAVESGRPEPHNGDTLGASSSVERGAAVNHDEMDVVHIAPRPLSRP